MATRRQGFAATQESHVEYARDALERARRAAAAAVRATSCRKQVDAALEVLGYARSAATHSGDQSIQGDIHHPTSVTAEANAVFSEALRFIEGAERMIRRCVKTP
jgi:hypothetical protein